MLRRVYSSACALAILASLCGLVVAGPLHLLLSKHEICPLDGEIVHADGSSPSGTGHARAPVGVPTPHRHDRDRCTYATLLRAPGEQAHPTTTTPAQAESWCQDVPLTEEATPRPIATLALAPSHSPPA